jgi:hypothetical protein
MSRKSRRLDAGTEVPKNGDPGPKGAADRSRGVDSPRKGALLNRLENAPVSDRSGICELLRQDGSPRALAALAELKRRWSQDEEIQFDLSGLRDAAARELVQDALDQSAQAAVQADGAVTKAIQDLGRYQ